MRVRSCLFAGVVALVGVTPVSAQEGAAQEQVGRYTIVEIGAHTFLLDTVKGDIWQHVRFSDVSVWQFMYRLDDVEHTEIFLKEVLPTLQKFTGTNPSARSH
jgi:hypothetical protein